MTASSLCKLVLLLVALSSSSVAQVEPSVTPAAEAEAKPELTEHIRFKSPDGKYALRIMYDAALNEGMKAHNRPENDGIFSQAMDALAIVSLPEKKVMQDLTEITFQDGNNFEGLKLLWSSDSKWCAFYHRFPRVGYTRVYHLAGDKFKLAHKPYDLGIDSKEEVRNEHIEPVRWVKPGVLDLSIERVYDSDEPGGDTTAFTASFDGRGKWRVLKKKR